MTAITPNGDEAVMWCPAGVDYCRLHHGVRNEDEEWCDMAPYKEDRPCDLTPLFYEEADRG